MITSNVLQQETGINYQNIKQALYKKQKKTGYPSVGIKRKGLDFILFTQMANGQKNIIKVGGIIHGNFTILQIKEEKQGG